MTDGATLWRATGNTDLSSFAKAISRSVQPGSSPMAQEAAANAAHHANARTLAVQLACDGAILLRVCDDRRGFDPQQAVSAGHYGLAGMRERAQLVGGELTVTSRPGHGTTVQLVIKDGAR